MYSMILMMTMAASGPAPGYGHEPVCCGHGFLGSHVPFYYRHFDPYYTAPGGAAQGLGYLLPMAGCLGYPMSYLDDRGGFGFTGAFVAPLVYRPEVKVSSNGYGFGYPQKIAPATYVPPTPPDGTDPEKIDAPKIKDNLPKNQDTPKKENPPVDPGKELPDPVPPQKSSNPAPANATLVFRPQTPDYAPAVVIVQLPADAKLTVNDRLTQQTGRSERKFLTPPLPVGESFEYIIRLDVVRGGQTHAEAKRVQVRAGETTTVVFEEPRPATSSLDRIPPIQVPHPTTILPAR
jgi:uncharacterized protein (TIGR03000 family)